MMQLVRNKENLFGIPVEIQSSQAVVVDLDSPVGSPNSKSEVPEGQVGSMPENYIVTLGRLEKVLTGKLKKFSLESQVKQCTDTVNKEMDDLIGCVDIDERGIITAAHNSNWQQYQSIDGLSRIAARQLSVAVSNIKSLENAAPAVSAGGTNRSQLIFSKPTPGQEVYAMSKHSLFYWLPAKVLKVNLNSRPSVYTVQFQQKVKPRSKSIDDADMYVKELTGRQVAFKKPTSAQLPIGCRIIAKFKDLLRTDGEVDGMLYAGVTAEVPKNSNKQRYLIFFDDGYAQYVSQADIFPIVEASPDVWLDVHTNSRDFIRDYVEKYPNRHMIRAQINAGFNVELNAYLIKWGTISEIGRWLPAQIVEVDGSLMKVRYLRRNPEGVQFEWIYRGSTRLGPLFSRIKSLEAKPVTTCARRHTYSARSHISFEVNQDTVEEDSKIAKKITGTGPLPHPTGQTVRVQNGMIISTILETKGSMIRINIPDNCPTSRTYVQHNCSPKCAYPYEEDKYRRVSPLAIPFYLGWARQLTKTDQVFYVTPCGVRCGSYKEIHSYIVQTKASIPIDFFSMESIIDCLNAFEPERKIESVRDISYGKEWTPVAFVNSLDHDLPVYMEYITARVKGKGVNLNDDDGFLTCCDCEDDCEDKEKCSCWQMTMSGISFKIGEMEGEKLQGYENRRLKGHVLSGIYECNRNCKCRSTCFNRVVQNKVKWPVQIFKTFAKGWGVRALHDMPQGSFICVYTGQLLTDNEANEKITRKTSPTLNVKNLVPEALLGLRRQLQQRNEIEPKKQDVAKKSTGGKVQQQVTQRAHKSTGGMVRRNGDDSSSSTSSIPPTRPVARKSGSKNGSGSTNNGGGSKKPSPNSSGVPSPALSKRSSKDDSDSDDDEGTGHAYSSFYATTKDEGKPTKLTLREYFGKDESVYIMDAKSMGNFGRYLNHSCDPNVFVQNLFVDTHDPRFPWVAFFTKKDVKAGTELTWDYNYEIGSVPGKTLYCYCLQNGCRGKLL
ncbi:Histone-lysine N-methyltransferase eggless [Orchesella cincta]|uniref:Histone-lysine N-methyltransferase eggless n=1 Tax=Orchesella cincta TaxID=48709 RepID=A0A1D2N373_ORCCI|nr:Histone-lysine N-methyltransferase eggless [Orchesella cincta]